MKMQSASLSNPRQWEAAGVKLPAFDWEAMCRETAQNPTWVHFGAGNIFRGFIAKCQQDLLNAGLVNGGIIAADTFDYDIIDKIYDPYDSMTMLVSLMPFVVYVKVMLDIHIAQVVFVTVLNVAAFLLHYRTHKDAGKRIVGYTEGLVSLGVYATIFVLIGLALPESQTKYYYMFENAFFITFIRLLFQTYHINFMYSSNCTSSSSATKSAKTVKSPFTAYCSSAL